jgi:hypothetical protein
LLLWIYRPLEHPRTQPLQVHPAYHILELPRGIEAVSVVGRIQHEGIDLESPVVRRRLLLFEQEEERLRGSR